jgi:DNA-binding response OmpR family regulator
MDHPLAHSLFLCYRYFYMTQRTVLIIEDEEDAADMFAEMMRVSGYRVLKTTSSTPALTMMSAENPDVVILDIMMPEISGLDILRQMRQDSALAKIPVVIVSAKSLPADIKIGMEAGASIYLTKPVGFIELKEAIERALGGQSTPS